MSLRQKIHTDPVLQRQTVNEEFGDERRCIVNKEALLI